MGGKVKSAFISGNIAVLALGALLAGCSNSSSNGAGTGSSSAAAGQNGGVEPFVVTAYIGESQQQPTPDNKIYKLMKEKLGVTFKFDFLAGDSKQKMGVMVAGGDYPDLLTGNTTFIDAGAYIPLEDLIEKHAPNLKKLYAPYWNKMKDPKDGHIYVLPNYGVISGKMQTTWYGGPAFWIQKAVLKEFGFPKVKTLDEYFALIKKYKEKYPQIEGKPTVGFEILNSDWRKWGLLNAPQHLIGHPNDGGVVVKDNVAAIFADKDYAKKYYKKLNEVNQEGLLDKEAFVQNYDQYMAKISAGNVLGMFDQHWNFQKAEEALHTQQKYEREYVGLPLVYDTSTKDYYLDRPALNLNNGFGISVKAKDPVKIIKLFDTIVTDEWQKILIWGIPGEDYQVDAKGRFSRTQEQRDRSTDATWKLANKADAFFGYAPKIDTVGSFPDGNAASPGNQPEEYLAGLKDYDKEVLNAYGFKTYVDFFSEPPENPVPYPAWTINLVDGSPAKIANTKIDDLSTKYLPKAVLSKPDQFDAVWDEYVAQIAKANPKAYEDRINEQIQWRLKNWSK